MQISLSGVVFPLAKASSSSAIWMTYSPVRSTTQLGTVFKKRKVNLSHGVLKLFGKCYLALLYHVCYFISCIRTASIEKGFGIFRDLPTLFTLENLCHPLRTDEISSEPPGQMGTYGCKFCMILTSVHRADCFFVFFFVFFFLYKQTFCA